MPGACTFGAANEGRRAFTRFSDEQRALRRLQREQAPSPYVFTSERGGPIAPKSFHTLMVRLGERADIPFPIHPHMLRHGCGYGSGSASGWIRSQEVIDRFDAACKERAGKVLDEARAMAEPTSTDRPKYNAPCLFTPQKQTYVGHGGTSALCQ